MIAHVRLRHKLSTVVLNSSRFVDFWLLRWLESWSLIVMAKRVADKYITDQNWDKEEPADESDEKGEFRKASDDILKSRVIRRAKRRTTAGQQVRR